MSRQLSSPSLERASAQAVGAPRPERIDLILNQLDQLPTLPAVATRILQVTSSEDSSAQDVVRIVESDQSLSAKILKMVANASLGASRDVDTIDKAVVLLGFDAIRHAVLSVKIFDTIASVEGMAESHFDRCEFWKHSLAVASASYLLAERWPGHLDPEVAFVCGLLHDLGKVALDMSLPKSYDRVVSMAMSRHVPVIDVEQELLGVNHTVAGKRLAQRWRLPASIVECCWLHHHTPDMLPDSVSNPDLVQIVNLSDIWVREQRLGFSGCVLEGTSSTEIAAQMGMPVEHLSAIAPQLLDRIEERAELLGLNELTPSRMFAQTVTNVNLELGRLNEELSHSNQQLETRSQVLELMNAFHCSLPTRLAVTDVCQVGARHARRLLDANCVVLFTRHRTTANLYYVGFADEDGDRADVFSIADSVENGFDSAALATSPGIVAAPPSTAAVYERLGQVEEAPFWMLPIVKEAEVWGGILFHAPQADVQQLNHQTDEMSMFAMALANALIDGHERMLAERLNEGLAEVNRRLKATQAELLQTRTVSMIAEMAAGAAHELNNPLAVIAGRSQLLASAVVDEKFRGDLQIITDQAHRASDIVNELIDFAKPSPPQPERICLPELLQHLIAEWLGKSSLLPDQITLEISDGHLYLDADRCQIEKMFDELIKNAFEAVDPQKARLSINCRSDVTDEMIVVIIEDNGCGMSTEVLEKARAPFFSYRSAGRGRGLGLSRAARWCEINDGKLRMVSQPDVGTKVWIEFPISK